MVSGRINVSSQLSAISLLLVMFFCGIAHAQDCPTKAVCADLLCLRGEDFSPIRLDLERCDNERIQLATSKAEIAQLESASDLCQKEVNEYKAIDELQQRRIALAQQAMKEYEHIIEFQAKVIEDLKPKSVNTFLDVLQKLAIGMVGFLVGRGL